MLQTAGIMTDLSLYFKTDPRIQHAWLFGSFSRFNSHENSDVDVMIEMKSDQPYTLFDLFEIQQRLEKILKRKVDVVEKDYMKPFAWATAKKDLIAIV